MMAKVEEALRDMIQQQTKRAVSDVVSELSSQVRELRREARDIRKAIDRLGSDLSRLGERKRSAAAPSAAHEDAEAANFSPTILKDLRERFDVTQQELARLLEVSPVTVTAWETGKSHPRSRNLTQLTALGEKEQADIDAALGRPPVPDFTSADIKRLRKGLGVTQTKLARLIGVSPAAVTAWETGKTLPKRASRHALGQLVEKPRAEVDAQLQAAGLLPPQEATISGEEIKRLRQQADMSQRDLARKLGVSVNSVCNWETGRTEPRRASIKKLMELA
jgi:DNA-binding transcriptional regulator YiaG